MRTTVNIDEHVLTSMKELAARTRRPLGDVVTDGLRVYLARLEDRPGTVEIPTYGGSGFMPGVDLEDKDALAALLDEGEDSRAAG